MKKPKTGGEGDLAEAGRERHRPKRPDQLQVELDPDQEEQQRDAEFGQKVDLLADWAIPKTEGPAMMPTAMKLTISGWRSSKHKQCRDLVENLCMISSRKPMNRSKQGNAAASTSSTAARA
jgi:hypothetical protein